MPDHAIEWQPDPRTPAPELATATDHIEARLPQLSDMPNRVLRSSDLVPMSFEALVARLDADGRHDLIRRMQ